MAALLQLATRQGNAGLAARLSGLLTTPNGSVGKLVGRISSWNQARNGGEANLLLAQMFPEGSPAHPAWPSDHATIAGACVTVLKAIFNDLQPIRRPGTDAPWLVNGRPLTVGGELDKLASNIALGRSFAGVHYRSDGEHGIRLGEEVAIRYLQRHLATYPEEFRPCGTGSASNAHKKGKGGGTAGETHPAFTLTKRNGARVCITRHRVHVIPEPAAMSKAHVHPVSLL